MPMVHLLQTIHLSFTDINTTSKWTKMSIHLTLVTLELYRVRPKRFLCLSHVRRNTCTYLASRLTLSWNGPKRASTWPTSHRSNIKCVQMIFEPLVHSKPCTYFISRLILSPNRSKLASTWPTPCRSTISWVQNDLWAYGMLGANRAPILHQH
jgi:hypothetical protein